MLPLWDSQPVSSRAHVAAWLVTLNLVVFGVETALAMFAPETLEVLLQRYALVPTTWGETWRTANGWVPVLSSMFLHGSFAHVAGNAWFLWVFGRSLESHLGSGRFAAFYLLAGVAAALAQIAVDPRSDVPMIGASGAISGVLGAYLVLLPTRWIVALVPWIVPIVPLPAVVFLVLWFGLQLLNGIGSLGVSGGGVAWWAHAGGFVAGSGLAWLFGKSKPRRRKSSGGRKRR